MRITGYGGCLASQPEANRRNRARGVFPTCKPLRVLWSDWDNGGYETQIRLRAALRGRGWDGVAETGLYYMSEGTPWLALDNAGHVRRLIRRVSNSR